MKIRKIVICTFILFTVTSISFVGAVQPPLPPAFELLVYNERITSDTQLLKIFTPDESIKVGYDSAFFSALAALEKSNSVWIRRVTNAPLYGGVTIESSDSTDVSASYALGESTPEDDHVFGTNGALQHYFC